MGVVTRQHDDLDRLPPGAGQPGRVAPWAWAWPRWDVVLSSGVVLLALLGALWLLNPLFVYITFGILALGLFIRVVLFVGIAGYRTPTHRAVIEVDPRQALTGGQSRDTVYAGAVVPAQLTYNPQWQTNARGVEPAAAAPALVDGGPQLVADAEWLKWMDEAPHLMIGGRTKAGKTTLAMAIMTQRALAGDEILILDPHYQPGGWGGLPAVGGGRDFEHILAVFPQVIREMDERFKAYLAGQKTEQFRRLTILIDEVPAIVAQSMEAGPSGRPRLNDMRWVTFAKRIGSEARKVRISVVLLTQSTFVQDVMINTQLRENYIRVGLGDLAGALLRDAPPDRRPALVELLRGQQHPAAIEWDGDYHLLDTANVPTLAARRVPAQAWTPPAPLPAQIPPTVRVTPPPSVPTQPMAMTNQEQILDLLRGKPASRLTSTQIADMLQVDKKVIQTEIKELYDAHRVTRHEVSGRGDKYAYSVPLQKDTP